MEHYHSPHNHSRPKRPLKLFLPILAAVIANTATGQDDERVGDPRLRSTLSGLLAEGKVDQAVQEAQKALKARPGDAGVRLEFIDLHMSLARRWFRQHRFEDCETVLQAVLAVQDDHQAARAMLAEIRAARERISGHQREIDRLLRLELFEPALDQVQQVKALDPQAAKSIEGRERAAWLGTADDHYLARNFSEALTLYEKLLSLQPQSPNDVRLRWGLSLALAISDSDRRAERDVVERMLSRAADVLGPLGDALLERIIRGLLAEKSGQLVEAGRFLAAALGEVWELPASDRRRSVVTNLRNRAIKRLRALYDATPTRRREGAWAIALPKVWKKLSTAHFDVYARSDLIARYVGDALEFHFSGLSEWLAVEIDDKWTPRCEIRVYAGLEPFHSATKTSGTTRAVSRTRVQGANVLARTISVFQSDPWLLSSTLPHELTHILLAEALRGAVADGDATVPPVVLDEGLAVQAEPPARRLQFRRLLEAQPPNPLNLIRIERLQGEQPSFYARSGAFAGFVLHRKGVPGLLSVCRLANGPWWESLDWPSKEGMLADWKTWYASRRDPPRMPLMILSRPAKTRDDKKD